MTVSHDDGSLAAGVLSALAFTCWARRFQSPTVQPQAIRLGIMGIVGLVATLIFAIPVGGSGLTLLANGRTVFGGAMLLLAMLIVALPKFLTMPQDLPSLAAEEVADGVAKESSSEG